MTFEIICYRKDCRHWGDNHCFNNYKYKHIDENGCQEFAKNPNWKEGIQETVSEEILTKSDLKDIEQNKAKYGTKNER